MDDVADDELHISGHRPVDGYAMEMSSGRGEIHGVTAMSIMSQHLLHFHSSSAQLEAVCGNQGVINRCASVNFCHLKNHREKNTDLFMMLKTNAFQEMKYTTFGATIRLIMHGRTVSPWIIQRLHQQKGGQYILCTQRIIKSQAT